MQHIHNNVTHFYIIHRLISWNKIINFTIWKHVKHSKTKFQLFSTAVNSKTENCLSNINKDETCIKYKLRKTLQQIQNTVTNFHRLISWNRIPNWTIVHLVTQLETKFLQFPTTSENYLNYLRLMIRFISIIYIPAKI